MRLLLDSNIFLEILLDQEHAAEARQLLSRRNEHDMFISDFSLHSIGVILFRRKLPVVFGQFLTDVMQKAGVRMVSLTVEEMDATIETSQRFSLDFDDAYQYAVAARYELMLVSFDADFDRTDTGRRTPAQIL